MNTQFSGSILKCHERQQSPLIVKKLQQEVTARRTQLIIYIQIPIKSSLTTHLWKVH